MKVSFRPTESDQAAVEPLLRDLADKTKSMDLPIRLRLQPQLYHPKAPEAKIGSGSYRSWRRLVWTLELDGIEELLAFRGSLESLITFMERYGAVATETWFAQTLGQMAPPVVMKEPPDAG